MSGLLVVFANFLTLSDAGRGSGEDGLVSWEEGLFVAVSGERGRGGAF